MRLDNILSLFRKELASLWRDPVVLVVIGFAFSIAVYTVSRDIKTEVADAPVAVVDHDQSALSLRLRDALQPPLFKRPVELPAREVSKAMDEGRFIFVLDIPPGFEADVLRGRHPQIQLLVDATAMTQASIGASYIQQITDRESSTFLGQPDLEQAASARVVVRIAFNPNHYEVWFLSITQIILYLTILSIVLVGAAFMRERERGTVEHLLVTPVSAIEIALGKIIANSLVVAAAAWLSLELIIRGALGVPILGSVTLFFACVAPYLFTTAAIGILLATTTESMPQFALLSIPVFVVLAMLSGAIAPMESMPSAMQFIMQASPTTHFVALSEAVLFRNAGLGEIWQHLLIITVISVIALAVALTRFRALMAKVS